ncbi:MAG: PAS domain S-box protein [bacterium]
MKDDEMTHKIEFSEEELSGHILPSLQQMGTSLLFFRDGRLLEVSDHFREEFSYQEEDVQTLLDLLFSDRDERDRFLEKVRGILAGEVPSQEDYRVFTGQRRSVRVRAEFFKSYVLDGEPVCFCGLEKKKPEPSPPNIVETCQDEIFRKIADESINGIAVLDKNQKVLYMNHAGLEIFGLESFAELRENNIYSLLAPESRELLMDRHRQWLQGEKPDPVTFKIIRKDGEARYVGTMSSTIFLEGHSYRLISFVDVSGREEVEQALRESEEKYRLLAENSLDVIWSSSFEGGFKNVYVSPSIETMRGYTPEEHLTQPLEEILAPESYQRVMQTIIERFRKEEAGEPAEDFLKMELEYIRRDKSTFWAEVLINTVRDEQGRLSGITGISRDITERREAEERIRELSQFQEKVIDSAMVWLNVLDTEANVVLWNRAAEMISGYSKEEVIGHDKIWEWLYPDPEYRRQITDKAKDIIEAGQVVEDFETVIRRKDGEKRIISWNSRNLTDKNKNPTGSIAMGRDITERKRAQQALKESEKKYRMLFEDSPQANILVGTDGVINDINEHARQISGLEREEIVGRHFSDLDIFREMGDFSTLQKFREMKEGNNPGALCFEIENKEGTKRLIEAHPELLSREGEPYGILTVCVDITERKRAEDALKESEEKSRTQYRAIPVPTYTWQKKGDDFILAEFNDEAVKITEGAIERFQGIRATELYWDMPEILEDLHRCLREKTTIEKDEMAYRFKSTGKTKYLSVKYAYVPPDQVLVHTEDVTERRQALEALRESEEKYRLLAENISDVIWTTDPELNITYVSPSIETVSGYTPEEIMNTPVTNLMPEEIYNSQARLFIELLTGNREKEAGKDPTFSVETPFFRKDGSHIWTEMRWSVIRDPHGNITGCQGSGRDITQRKKTEQALEESQRRLQQALKEEVRHLRSKDLARPFGAESSYYQYPSQVMRRMIYEAEIATRSDGNLLLLGKSGVGKNHLATWIHQNSSRMEGPFFNINCASIPSSLIESELFGHEHGAFTGAQGQKKGLLELAHGGTLLLDEIGDMDPQLQSRLLNFLDDRTLRRVGGEKNIRVDTRIIAATNRNIEELVREGAFREDLYYRLQVLTIRVPPLTERKEDIPILASELLKVLAQEMGMKESPVIKPGGVEALQNYSWPGNVRELKNVLERALLRAEDKSLIKEETILKELEMAPGSPVAQAGAFPPLAGDNGASFQEAVDEYQRKLIRDALSKAGTKQKAAEILGLSRHALHRQMKRLGL